MHQRAYASDTCIIIKCALWGRSFLSVAWPTGVQLVFFSFAPELVSYLAPRDLHRRSAYSVCKSSLLIRHGSYHDLFVLDDSLTSWRFTTRAEELTKCCEPLQKLRVRLGTCKIGLSPPVISYY